MGQELICVNRTRTIWVVWDLPGQSLTRKIWVRRGYPHLEGFGRGGICHARRYASARSELAHAGTRARHFGRKIWGKLCGALVAQAGCAKEIPSASRGFGDLGWAVGGAGGRRPARRDEGRSEFARGARTERSRAQLARRRARLVGRDVETHGAGREDAGYIVLFSGVVRPLEREEAEMME